MKVSTANDLELTGRPTLDRALIIVDLIFSAVEILRERGERCTLEDVYRVTVECIDVHDIRATKALIRAHFSTSETN